MDIVMFVIGRYDAVYSSTYLSLAKEFAKNHRVFYIDNPITLKYFLSKRNTPEIQKRKKALLSRKEIYTDVIKTDKGQLTAVTTGLTIPINFLSQGSGLYNTLSKVNEKIIHKTLRKLIHDYQIKDFIYLNAFNPFYLQKLPSWFKPKVNCYMSVDDISQSVHIGKHGPALEVETIKNADLTLVTSRELQRTHLVYAHNVFLLPNAADVSLFRTVFTTKYEKPSELANNTKPVVIFMGHIEGRTDYDLLKAVAKLNPDKLMLMVGPISIAPALLEELKAIPNIIFTGGKKLQELPAYLQYAQCGIIPFKHNQLTKSIYPLKINEYLAAGKPVVTTSFSEDIMDFASVVSVADTAKEFSDAINAEITINSAAKAEARTRFVDKNNWEERAAAFWKIVAPFTKG